MTKAPTLTRVGEVSVELLSLGRGFWGVGGGLGGGGTQSGKGYQLRSDRWRAVAVATRDS